MKISRLLTASMLGISLLSTSAFASDQGNNGSGTHWSFLTWIYNPVADSRREADQFGQNSGRGNNCDNGRGNGAGFCGTGGNVTGGGGSSSGGGHSTGGGSTGGGGSTKGGGRIGPKG